jgi:hypothetical protein
VSGSNTEIFIANKFRSLPGCFCRQQDLFLGQLEEEVEKEMLESERRMFC